MLKRSRGFTLIEIMLVTIIIGCALGIVVLSLPGVNSQGDAGIKTVSERLTAILGQAAEQSVLEGRTIGVRIDDTGYQLMVRQSRKAAANGSDDQTSVATVWEDQVWVPYQKEKFASSGTFPDGTHTELELSGLALDPEERNLGMVKPDWFARQNEASSKEPQILLLPGGEITPFKLTLTRNGDQGADSAQEFAQLRGDEAGRVRLLTHADVEAEAHQ
jgi:general secretion pathway protein H